MTHGRTLLRTWLTRSQNAHQDLAAELGISRGYLSQILKGIRRPKLETLMQIEALTGVPVSSWADIRLGKSDRRKKRAQLSSM